MAALTVEEIVARCQEAVAEHTPPLAVRDVLEELMRDPARVEAALGPVTEGGITVLHRADDLTILHIAWTPGMTLNPHNHAMFGVVGMYGGQEDNTFYRRTAGGIVPSGGRSIRTGDVLLMGDDAIHAVENPLREYAVALHVYGGDFFADANRFEWDDDTLEERPRDMERTMRRFADANARWAAENAGRTGA